MEDINIKIPKVTVVHDLTIIYKGKKDGDQEEINEIKTSKDELTKKLRYFKQKMSEINHMNEIFIHDDFKFDVFKSFIDSTVSSQIQINHSNYLDFYELSHKYGYTELEEEIKKFIINRPDLKKISDHLSIENQKSDTLKEEIISKNLDQCIKNGFLDRIPLKILIRILNSPNRVVNDHHLLFDFVLNKMKIYENAQLDGDDKEIIQILPSCLDFCKMSHSEVVEIVKNKNFSSNFNPQNSQQIINTLSTELSEMRNSISKQQEQIQMLLLNFSEFTKFKENNEIKFQQLEAQMNKQKEIIQTQQTEIQNFQRKNQEYEAKFRQFETEEIKLKETIQSQKTTIENFQKQINENETVIQKIFTHRENSEFDGILRYLTNKTGGNIHDNKTIDISSNSIYSDSHHPKNLVDYSDRTHYCSNDEQDIKICFDMKENIIQLESYTIKSRNDGPNWGHLRNWVIEVSNDKNKWEIIDEHKNDSTLNERDIIATFETKKTNGFYRFIQLRQTGESWRYKQGNYMFYFKMIEFYGKLKIKST